MARWKTIELLNGYVLLADRPVESPPKRVHQEHKRLRDAVEKQLAPDRERFIVGSTPIRSDEGFRGWAILAAHAGRYEGRVQNILKELAI